MKQGMISLKKFIPCATSAMIAVCTVLVIDDCHAVSVSGRTAPARAKVTSTAAVRTPTVKTTKATTETSSAQKPVEAETITVEETFEFEDRTGMFDSAIGATNTSASGTTSDGDLAEMIRKQRAALNAADAATTTQNTMRTSIASGQNACDMGLRKCMQSKCGADFTKCSGDTDTTWGDKMDSCRRDLKCTGHEYQLFTTEIKADRDVNAQLANYNRIIECGNRYNSCIVSECGTTYSKCLGKTAGDLAISKCKKIQTECTQMDSGLASRTMNVFATLRQDAEKQIQRDEQRLYDLRDEMERTCRSLGAMFDQRSLDCVYTINFFADNNTTPYATKKSYAGGTFDCEPGWFGIDITTFKENAYRETIAQKSASAAMLGSGVGMAAGAITSGAMSRALETQKAEKAMESVEKEAEKEAKQAEKDAKKDARQEKRDAKKAEKDEKKAENKAERDAKKTEKKAERDAKKAEKSEERAENKAEHDAKKAEEKAERDAKKAEKSEERAENKAERDAKKAEKKAEKEEKKQQNQMSKAACDSVGGNWRPATKQCSCQDINGDTIKTSNIDDCIVLVEEEEIEENDDLNTTQIVCEDKGGTWSDGKCKCKNAKERNITTKNPVMDCVKPSETTNDEEYNDDEDDDLNTTQIVCEDKGGTWSNNKCKCKNAKGRNITTKNPVMDCVKPSETTNDKEDITYDDTESDDSDEENSEDDDGSGQAYSYTVGQKPKDYAPEASWAIYHNNKIFLEQDAKDKFINEKIAQEC
ncbi:MAG: hypothetical protein IKA08_00285 [Alphaproteobacteria bacterium]|nr:hypothetical protein [Alphaproteobacteria bacterium]